MLQKVASHHQAIRVPCLNKCHSGLLEDSCGGHGSFLQEMPLLPVSELTIIREDRVLPSKDSLPQWNGFNSDFKPMPLRTPLVKAFAGFWVFFPSGTLPANFLVGNLSIKHPVEFPNNI